MSELYYRDLYAHLKKLDKAFRDIDSTQRKYGKTTKRLLNSDHVAELDDKSSYHISELYNDFCTSLSHGEKIIELSLDRLDKVIASRDGPPDGVKLTKRREDKAGPAPKKQKRSSTSTTPIRNVESMGDIPIPVGHRVAAQVAEDEWILASIMEYHEDTKMYIVKDVDEEEKATHSLSKDQIIPTPYTKRKSSPFEIVYEFAKGTDVLAVFPETTCFYKATVVSSLRRHKKIAEYTLLFEDDEDEEGNVPRRRLSAKDVVPLPPRK